MKLIQRIGYYLGGFSIGLIILAFFLSGKKTSCAYGPEARVLKNINSKNITFSDDLISKISVQKIDTSGLRLLLKKGSINFSGSNPRQEPCGLYHIEGNMKEKKALLVIENCDSIAKILKLSTKND